MVTIRWCPLFVKHLLGETAWTMARPFFPADLAFYAMILEMEHP